MPKASSSLYSQHRAHAVALILLTSIIIGPYSRCSKKGLVYIIIATPFSYQPSFYSKCTKLNIRSGCNICLVSNGKYIHPITLNSL